MIEIRIDPAAFDRTEAVKSQFHAAGGVGNQTAELSVNHSVFAFFPGIFDHLIVIFEEFVIFLCFLESFFVTFAAVDQFSFNVGYAAGIRKQGIKTVKVGTQYDDPNQDQCADSGNKFAVGRFEEL